MRPGFVAVEDSNGWAFVQPEIIIAVSGPFSSKGGPVSRRLIMAGTPVMVYILNSAENAAALGFNPDEWASEEPKPQPKPKLAKGRKWGRRPAATVSPDWKPPV